MKICKIENCESKHKALGYCEKHYLRFKKYGDPLYTKNIQIHSEYCSVSGCDKKYSAKGYCKKHYWQFKIYGDPLYENKKLIISFPENLTDFDLGYIIGLFEGEGYIAFSKAKREDRKYYTVHIGIVNTNMELLRKILHILKIGNITEKPRYGNIKWKRCWVWRSSRQKDVLWFLEKTYPYLIEKKEKASLVMEYLKSRIACNPNARANRQRIYTDKERDFFNTYRQLKSYIPTQIRNNSSEAG